MNIENKRNKLMEAQKKYHFSGAFYAKNRLKSSQEAAAIEIELRN